MLMTWGDTVFESYRAYRADLATYDKLPPAALRKCIKAVTRWLEVLPTLRYHGESPCWRADCPMCGARGELWVTPVDPGTWLLDEREFAALGGSKDAWNCFACGACGPDEASLKVALWASEREREGR